MFGSLKVRCIFALRNKQLKLKTMTTTNQKLTAEMNKQFANPLPTLKSGEIKTSLRWVSMVQDLFTNGICRPIISQGSSWKHSSLYNETFSITTWLDSNGISYTQGNDAPKGGKTGNFIKV